MSSKKHMIGLKCGSDEKARKRYYWKTQTFDKILVDESLVFVSYSNESVAEILTLV